MDLQLGGFPSAEVSLIFCGALRMRVLIISDVQQQRARMESTVTKRVPKLPTRHKDHQKDPIEKSIDY